MRRLRLRGLPPLPFVSSFPQMNLRTYVTHDGRPGVLVLRVIVESRLAVAIGRRLFSLPYERGRLSMRREGEGWGFRCEVRAGEGPFSFAVRYRPEAPLLHPAAGSLEHWLSERFCYYATGRGGRLVRGDLDHPPWSLQPARLEVLEARCPAAAGIVDAESPALACYSPRQEAFAGLPVPIARALQNRASTGTRGSN